MSDSDDLFGAESDGGDTDELFAASKEKSKPIAKKKSTGGGAKKAKRLQKKSIPDADNDSDGDDAAHGLFDSDDDEPSPSKGRAKKMTKKPTTSSTNKPMTKREKMEALKKKARAAAGLSESSSKAKRDKGGKDGDNSDRKKASSTADGNPDKGYESQDSYDSGTEYQRTKEDDDFIDVEGDDEDAVREYYAEQHFDDERPADEEEGLPAKGKKKGGSKRSRGPDALTAEDEKDENNPIMIAVKRMKKKKKTVKSFEEKKEAAEEFVSRMEYAADEDDLAIKEKRPGLKKLQMLPTAVDMMTNREMVRPLLESDVLSAVKRWIQPLPDGSLGNVTVRSQMIDVIGKMGTGEEHGIDTDDLKKSGFGKLVMTLYMHKKETPTMKKQLKKLIEEWSRTIFGKSGDMRDLASAQQTRRRNTGLTAFARSQAAASAEKKAASPDKRRSSLDSGDIGDVISKGVKQARDMGKNRVRIPYSKGFQYSIRPSDVTGDVTDKKTRISNVRDARSSLHKTMLDKKRPVSKNARSANISIEGRPTK